MTEKQVEAYLEAETRMLPLPEGGTRPMTGTKLMWHSVDFLTETKRFTLSELVGLSRLSMAEMGYSFEEAFQSVVAYARKAA